MVSHRSRTASRDVQRVLDGIRRIVQALRVSSREAERHAGVSSAQFFVLRQLAEAAPTSINELAARTFTHQSSVSVVVSRLTARGLVTARRDPGDKRRRQLTITPAGRRLLGAAPGTAQEDLVAAVTRLTPAARRAVGRALASIADGMAAARRPSMFFEEHSKR
jgi:DNA-binding MarR family transcriptional regulator